MIHDGKRASAYAAETDFKPDPLERAPVHTAPPFMGKHFARCRAEIYLPALFFPDPVESIRLVCDGGPRRGNNINITMAVCRGSRPTIKPRESL